VVTHGEYDLGQFEAHLGDVLAREHKTDEARAVLTDSVAILTRSVGPGDTYTTRAQALLAGIK
jgi:hypothetical protein